MIEPIGQHRQRSARWVTMFNPSPGRLLAAGVPLGPNGLITIRGRTSGLPRTTPVAIIERLRQALGLVPVGRRPLGAQPARRRARDDHRPRPRRGGDVRPSWTRRSASSSSATSSVRSREASRSASGSSACSTGSTSTDPLEAAEGRAGVRAPPTLIGCSESGAPGLTCTMYGRGMSSSTPPTGPTPEASAGHPDRFPETVVAEALGATFFSLDEKHWPNYATIVTTDEHDEGAPSNLARPGAFRLNIGSAARRSNAWSARWIADYAAYDRLLPHPVYAKQHWISILNPSDATFDDRPAADRRGPRSARRGASPASDGAWQVRRVVRSPGEARTRPPRSRPGGARRSHRGSAPGAHLGPQPCPFVAGGGPGPDRPRAVRQVDRGVRMGLQVEPPGGLRFAPAVHREREQVRTVLEVAEDRDPRRAAAPADRVDAQQAVRLRRRRSKASSAAGQPVDRAVNGPCGPDEPAGRQEWSWCRLLHASGLHLSRPDPRFGFARFCAVGGSSPNGGRSTV